MNRQSITLNLPINLTDQQWAKVGEVYASLDGWRGTHPVSGSPHWYGFESDAQFIGASAEPSGLLIEGNVDSRLWVGWISVMCARLSLALNMEIHDAEM
jgi:hypothetical protein